MALNRTRIAVLAGVLAAGSGCGGPLLEDTAPPGFAEAEHDWRTRHYKASDNVGLRFTVFDNVRGGTLEYWGNDLVDKLQQRGYVLLSQGALRSDNNLRGTRYDFRLSREDADEPMFLVVGLFVTDDYRYVAQLAGRDEFYETHASAVPTVFGSLRPTGCRRMQSVCARSGGS